MVSTSGTISSKTEVLGFEAANDCWVVFGLKTITQAEGGSAYWKIDGKWIIGIQFMTSVQIDKAFYPLRKGTKVYVGADSGGRSFTYSAYAMNL